ncbi:MAG: hypothetical protein JRN20_15640 [Nitrososphaerota archaeon]|nr:hypothetical protein [Nitrososphaerota archaeon]
MTFFKLASMVSFFLGVILFLFGGTEKFCSLSHQSVCSQVYFLSPLQNFRFMEPVSVYGNFVANYIGLALILVGVVLYIVSRTATRADRVYKEISAE